MSDSLFFFFFLIFVLITCPLVDAMSSGEVAMGKHLIGILILSLALLLPGRYTPCIESKPLHLAMILSCGETEAEQGFKDRLQELGYTVYSTVLNAEQDHKKLGVLLHELIPKLESFDYIYTFGTTVSSTPRVSVNNRVPQMLHVVSDPRRRRHCAEHARGRFWIDALPATALG
jgi:hypothetical protein